MNSSERRLFAANRSSRLRNVTGSAPLHSAPRGARLIIVHIPEGRSRAQLIRFGIVGGDSIRCLERLPGGTMVIEKNRQEIAIGAALAKTILVAYPPADERAKP